LLVIVFLAVSGAQRNRRDSQRKTDLSRIGAQVESYASNNNGCYPGSASQAGCGAGVIAFAGAATCTGTQFCNSTYVTGMNLKDPLSGLDYTYQTGALAAGDIPDATTASKVSYQVGAGTTCDGAANSSYRVYVVRMDLEQGTACRDNK
jgi:hypothetical protein